MVRHFTWSHLLLELAFDLYLGAAALNSTGFGPITDMV